ncbi:MAG: hypothetical protein AMXMBFR64_00400 [Myxococcales bacterium]
MSGEGRDERHRLGRRTFLVGASVGAVALAGAIPMVRGRRVPAFTVQAAAFEQEVGVRIPNDLAPPAELALVLRCQGTERVLSWHEAPPGEEVRVRLAYPFGSLVPGEYTYVARVTDARGAAAASEPLTVTLSRYRFGC